MGVSTLLADIVALASSPDESRATYFSSLRSERKRDTVLEAVPHPSGCVLAIQQGDVVAFRSLFEEYANPLTRFASVLINDCPAAQDIVADVFAALWRTHEEWNPRDVRQYLYGAVRNRCYNHSASRLARREDTLGPEHDQSIDSSIDSQLDAERLMATVKAILQSLPPQRRAAALLRWESEMSFAEIAAALDISENAARLHVSRAVRAIRHLVPGVAER